MAVNAPTAGKITELLAKEEDTVVVGQDLFRIEAGEGGGVYYGKLSFLHSGLKLVYSRILIGC